MEIPSVFSYLDNLQGKKVFDFGFGTAAWHSPLVSPEGQQKVPAQFWQSYLNQPHAAIVGARLEFPALQA